MESELAEAELAASDVKERLDEASRRTETAAVEAETAKALARGAKVNESPLCVSFVCVYVFILYRFVCCEV